MTLDQIQEMLNQLAVTKLEETWAGLNRNPSPDEVEKNKRLGDIWKKTATMPHIDYLKGIRRGMENDYSHSASDSKKALDATIAQHDHDPEADEENKKKMKSAKPKLNVYQ